MEIDAAHGLFIDDGPPSPQRRALARLPTGTSLTFGAPSVADGGALPEEEAGVEPTLVNSGMGRPPSPQRRAVEGLPTQATYTFGATEKEIADRSVHTSMTESATAVIDDRPPSPQRRAVAHLPTKTDLTFNFGAVDTSTTMTLSKAVAGLPDVVLPAPLPSDKEWEAAALRFRIGDPVSCHLGCWRSGVIRGFHFALNPRTAVNVAPDLGGHHALYDVRLDSTGEVVTLRDDKLVASKQPFSPAWERGDPQLRAVDSLLGEMNDILKAGGLL